MKFTTLLAYATTVFGIQFTSPAEGETVYLDKDFTISWLNNVPLPDQAEYTLGWRETGEGVNDHWHPVAQQINTATTHRLMNGNLFPHPGQYQLCAYFMGKIAADVYPPYVSKVFHVHAEQNELSGPLDKHQSHS